MGLTVEPFGLAIGMEDVHGGLFTAIQDWREPHQGGLEQRPEDCSSRCTVMNHVALSYY